MWKRILLILILLILVVVGGGLGFLYLRQPAQAPASNIAGLHRDATVRERQVVQC